MVRLVYINERKDHFNHSDPGHSKPGSRTVVDRLPEPRHSARRDATLLQALGGHGACGQQQGRCLLCDHAEKLHLSRRGLSPRPDVQAPEEVLPSGRGRAHSSAAPAGTATRLDRQHQAGARYIWDFLAIRPGDLIEVSIRTLSDDRTEEQS